MNNGEMIDMTGLAETLRGRGVPAVLFDSGGLIQCIGIGETEADACGDDRFKLIAGGSCSILDGRVYGSTAEFVIGPDDGTGDAVEIVTTDLDAITETVLAMLGGR